MAQTAFRENGRGVNSASIAREIASLVALHYWHKLFQRAFAVE
jgi:hypothetical protein